MDYMQFITQHFWISLGIAIVLLVIFLYIVTSLINRHYLKKLNAMIDEAPITAENMKPGQTIVRTLGTTNDDIISRFLEPFTADKFTVKVSNRQVGGKSVNYNNVTKTYDSQDNTRYVTVLTITKKY
ncbi:hypothetical protein [Apilactobacillus xinyiensis]|uniref:Uncharacterized protein n=1 Tax=Apilactobacillus xinyiensis TaxID=2841032 RepID=A0ABT0I2B5_9LACO|nr:hypothetical protein [Apilactobacillus xinyiensis]MCK8624847.1 hypothetical protein [Apilactobacillus xinyiensis]MCL0312264.1 hypothetical protein [Apilactobacillus xinyiensis]MCL0319237.1 hypothetical protein [Apilactobacillus xinyiensis]MCL0329782.1 hypothetical protein [Apilactobacillus xinyiensis]